MSKKLEIFFKEIMENENNIKKILFPQEKKVISRKNNPTYKKNSEHSRKIFKNKEREKSIWEIDFEKNFALNFFSQNLKNIFLNFFQAKKILRSRKLCFIFEKMLSFWLKKNFCFIFKKKIIKI
uniref:Uncharacterized protein n=1 Tax=Hemiselmis tepida TaxID=464990 RepID=A0A7S0YX76_9CRYP|mmetsp:Transcript_33829/g.86729  ORF Transcript_33829/g.86729 Transcript_33829/m.86729 type:complete len:124 (+) Transcript_33829:272-643(+)